MEGLLPELARPDPAGTPRAGGGDPCCPNCGFRAPLAFCPSCGQAQETAPPTLRAWAAEFVDDTFGVNARLPRTLAMLVRSPGLATAEWLAGRRARYVAPLRLYVICSLAMFGTAVALRFVGEQFGVGYRPQGALSDGSYAEVARRSATQALFVLVPLFAAWLAVLYRRSGRVYIEHLVFALHVHAFAFAATTAGYLMVFAPAPLVQWLQAAFKVWVLVYLALALRRVYGGSGLRSAAKGVALFLFQGVATAALTLLLTQLTYDPPAARQAPAATESAPAAR